MATNSCTHELFKALSALDDAWMIELENTFGPKAGDMRYEEAGQGYAGSILAEVYILRMAAFRAWENAKIRNGNLKGAYRLSRSAALRRCITRQSATTKGTYQMTITTEMLVQREVGHCVSSLVSTLAKHSRDGWQNPPNPDDIEQLAEQARELSYPLQDYEGAAEEAGWTPTIIGDVKAQWQLMGTEDGKPVAVELVNSAQEACENSDIEPHDREVYEHWIVSDWLADKLEAKGEKVDRDFAGLTIWARTTTGQAISLDWVIVQITAELNAR